MSEEEEDDMRNPVEPAVAPVRKAVVVPQGPEAAFRLFTRDMGRWWPLATHSVAGVDAVDVAFEERAGGRIGERDAAGGSSPWGTVLEWDPPRRFLMSWHPGRDAATAQQVEVRFEAVAEGTRVEVVHAGWETLGERAAEVRGAYENGWDPVLARYAERAAA